MNLLWSAIIHLLISVVLGAGVVLLMFGKPALLIAGLVVYGLMFARVGCASH